MMFKFRLNLLDRRNCIRYHAQILIYRMLKRKYLDLLDLLRCPKQLHLDDKNNDLEKKISDRKLLVND